MFAAPLEGLGFVTGLLHGAVWDTQWIEIGLPKSGRFLAICSMIDFLVVNFNFETSLLGP